MIITGTPSKFHAAYNPIIFEATRSSSSEEYASISLYDENSTLIATLTRAFYSSRTNFDVSGIVCNLFNTTEPTFSSGVAVDKRLFVKYKVGDTWYYAINSAVEMGAPSSFIGKIGVILTRFSDITLYPNYPIDISILVNDTLNSLTAESINRVQDIKSLISSLSDSTDTDIYLVDNSGNYILDESLNYILLNKASSTIGSTLTVNDGYIPSSPFYVRWINNIGGFDYWMFSTTQSVKTELKSSTSFRKYYTDSEAERGRFIVYGKEAEDTVTVGASSLTEAQYKAISLIPYSPLIEWYNENTQKWVQLTNDKEDNARVTSKAIQEIELTFTLPQRTLQF